MTARHSIFDRLDNSPAPSAYSWPSRRPPSVAMANARAALEVQARKTIARETKLCTRQYIRFPSLLDFLDMGLSGLAPGKMVARTRYLFARFSPPISPAPRAACIYARYLRATAHRLAKRRAP